LRTRFFIVHNPRAGPAARHFYDATLSSLKRSGSAIEIVETARHGEGMTAAANAARSGCFDAIVAAGGDGTLHDVAEGIIGHSLPLGIIPTGTGNVFAQEINLPQSADELAKTLREGEAHAIPVGQVNGRPFLFMVGVGFDAEAVRLFESGTTRELGRFGFVWPVLRALRFYKDRPLHVKTRQTETVAQWVIVTRAKRYAGGFMLAPDADLHDSQFQVLRMGGIGPLSRFRQLAALAIGGLRYDPQVSIEPANWVRIEGDPNTPVQIDGEVLGELPLEIGLHAEQLRIIMPHTAAVLRD